MVPQYLVVETMKLNPYLTKPEEIHISLQLKIHAKYVKTWIWKSETFKALEKNGGEYLYEIVSREGLLKQESL